MALISCPECNASISDQAPQCPQCGYAAQAAPPPAPTPAAAAAVSDDDLLDAAIGPTNLSYYRRRFDNFAAGGSASWNWPSFFITIFWMLYRKMYAYALLVWLVLPIVLIFVAGIFVGISGDQGVAVGTYYLLNTIIGYIVIPIFANKLYNRHVNKKISRAKALYSDSEDQLREVYRTGGTSGAGLIVGIIMALIVLAGILAAIAIPAYQDYTIRAQVSEGLNLSAGAKAAVTEYIQDTREFPLNNQTAGLSPANEIYGKYVSSVAVDEGQVVVTYGNNANAVIQGQVLYLIPDASSDPNVSWTCYSQDIANKLLPAACRN